MANKPALLAILVGFAALFWQLLLRDAIYNGAGLGRKVQPISDFPYRCHRVSGDPNIQACEDMWLDQKSRTLYLACSDSMARKQWMPNIHRLNASARALNDHVVAMDIDSPTGEGGYAYRVLKTPGFAGVDGDGRIHVVGMTGTTSAYGVKTQIWLVNARPSVNAKTGELLDNTATGANSTIEVFETQQGSDSVVHLRTYADPQIATPNNVAVAEDGGFFFTNDHGPHKVGWQHHLSSFIGTGDVSYCSSAGVCKKVAHGFKFPNGLHLGSDGLLYVPSAAIGGITVFRPKPDGSLLRVHFIDLDYPLDNLSEDSNGDIYAAALPKGMQSLAAFEDPLNQKSAPAAVWRVRRLNRDVPNKYQYELTKVIEDAEGELLPSTTTCVHDAKTGRLFLSGELSLHANPRPSGYPN
ncbi:hypothetical protein A1O7_07878 [Cladophialophora yegresii CBS 114405]|uniref:Uncharacterized protein n=1 Tax=Cladophialophora yegresii CBS 114405 TaxID=1182544 RepID=W9VXU4_9EURO|nr:uncharacterized protein A1O7_07878 [Cladophialophora yegresii CBS 114405]EXJ57530.1 hypothetical protein A1O7_07878 [Cladophialophora yegresii CBS 114405]